MIPNSLAKSCQEFRPDGFPEGLVAPEFQIYTAPSLPRMHALGDVSAHDVPCAVSLEVGWIYVVLLPQECIGLCQRHALIDQPGSQQLRFSACSSDWLAAGAGTGCARSRSNLPKG